MVRTRGGWEAGMSPGGHGSAAAPHVTPVVAQTRCRRQRRSGHAARLAAMHRQHVRPSTPCKLWPRTSLRQRQSPMGRACMAAGLAAMLQPCAPHGAGAGHRAAARRPAEMLRGDAENSCVCATPPPASRKRRAFWRSETSRRDTRCVMCFNHSAITWPRTTTTALRRALDTALPIAAALRRDGCRHRTRRTAPA